MIEVIYKEEKQEAKGNEGVFTIPRNIRQIGLISEDYRIYVEDYVYTFLERFAESKKDAGNGKGCLAVLTGDTKWSDGITYVFIRGVLAVEGTETTSEHIGFSEDIWTKIHEEEEKYFPGQEVVGWFFGQPELPLESNEVFQRTHLKYFGGGEKVLMLMDPIEREDAFFRYENGFLVRQEGYYLYYEKNPLMQAYMLEKNRGLQPKEEEEVQDDAVKAFRKIIKGKKREEQEEAEVRTSVFSYAATACLALAVLAVGTNFYRNYQEMERVNQQAETVASVLAEDNGEERIISPTAAITPTPKPSVTAVPSAKPEVTGTEPANRGTEAETANQGTEAETANQGTEAGQDIAESAAVEEQQSAEENRIYQEESDVRKAKRKQEAVQSQQENKTENVQQENSVDASAQETVSGEQAASGSEVRSSYVIRPGDTLYQISMEKYGNMDAISEICRINGLSAEEIIYPGQIIVLP